MLQLQVNFSASNLLQLQFKSIKLLLKLLSTTDGISSNVVMNDRVQIM